MREKRKCGINFIVRCFCIGGNKSRRSRKSVKKFGNKSSKLVMISEIFLIIFVVGFLFVVIFCCISTKFLKFWLRISDISIIDVNIISTRVSNIFNIWVI